MAEAEPELNVVEEVALQVVPGIDLSSPAQDVPVLITVQSPEGQRCSPCDVCVLVDTSWSMSMEAVVTSAQGTSESNGLSLLDIAKHALRTIINNLGDDDRLSIVQFGRKSTLVLPLTHMTSDGKTRANECCERDVNFANGTNLWVGMELALDALREGRLPGRFSHLMVLTDGETEDRETVMENLHRYKKGYEELPGTINTFGFGYEIDSELLVQISEFSNGSYAFIPDAGFVGTVFVNAISNLLVTMAKDVKLTLEADSGAQILSHPGYITDGTVTIDLGCLQYGQSRDIVLRMATESAVGRFLVAAVTYTPCVTPAMPNPETQTITCEASPECFSEEQRALVAYHAFRNSFVMTLQQAVRLAKTDEDAALPRALELLTAMGEEIKNSEFIDNEAIAALLEDVLGQCTEAFSRQDWFTKWGRHYIPSVSFAHRQQQCNNFKDPGVQLFGGRLFQDYRDGADDVFNTLEPPKVTPAMYRYYGNGQLLRNPDYRGAGLPAPRGAPQRATPGRVAAPGTAVAARAAAPVSMAAYNDRYGACMDEACLATKPSGEQVPLRELARGDRLLASGGTFAEVDCIVRMPCSAGRATLVEMPGGARLTPHHPVKVGAGWRFPIDVAEAKEYKCDAVCSLVLRGGGSDVLIGGVPCISLGHGVQEGAAQHAYFGTQAVLNDLKRFPGYRSGYIELRTDSIVRNADTGEVCGFRPWRAHL